MYLRELQQPKVTANQKLQPFTCSQTVKLYDLKFWKNCLENCSVHIVIIPPIGMIELGKLERAGFRTINLMLDSIVES